MSLRQVIKRAALSALRFPGVAPALRACRRGSLLILAYHGVDEPGDPVVNGDGFHVTPDRFRRQLEELARNFRVLPAGEAIMALQDGTLPPGAACVTFDDGYANNFEKAAPILRALGLPAVFFLTSGFLDGTHTPWWYEVRGWIAGASGGVLQAGDRRFEIRTPADRLRMVAELEREIKSLPPSARARQLLEWTGGRSAPSPYPFMTWAQAADLARQGFELGSHTVSHPSLGGIPAAERSGEIADATRRIEEKTGVRPALFAYPYGRPQDCPAAAGGDLAAARMLAAVTTSRGWNSRRTDRFQLRRMNVTQHHDGLSFPALLSGLSG